MSNKIEPKFSSFSAERDEVVNIKSISTVDSPVTENTQSMQHQDSLATPKKGTSLLLTITLYIAVGCSTWWFYQENLKLQHTLSASTQRITQLEQQLSLTGETLDESAGTMKVKLAQLSTQSEQLMSEVDKLWASAWRKNKAEISTLKGDLLKHQTLAKENNSLLTGVNTSLSTLKQNQSTYQQTSENNSALLTTFKQNQLASALNVDRLWAQMDLAQTSKKQLNTLQQELSRLEKNTTVSGKEQTQLAAAINQLDTQINIMFERLQRIEAKQKPAKITRVQASLPTTIKAGKGK